jgi:hypothetical protein
MKALVVVVAVVAATLACGAGPPQIVDYSPLRGARDVSTAAPIVIAFDHDVDQASVAQRLHLVPSTDGTIKWLTPRRLALEHPPLLPATTYEVVLEAGYRDTAGTAYVLRHHWSFVTEGPPSFAASSPADGDGGVDPADYLSVDFTRAMDESSLQGAISFTPAVAFAVRLDPADNRRAIVAPDALLGAGTTYQLQVGPSALDVDGNQLDRVRTVSFTTGAVRPLRHWVAFTTVSPEGVSGGLWMVNESGFPRQLVSADPVQSYSWSPEGDRLVYETTGGAWATFTPGGATVPLDFKASWAAALASGLGTVYIDPLGRLQRELPDGTSYTIASSVADVAVGPGGDRIAFAVGQLDGTSSIWGYDIGLRSRYLLGTESGIINALSWSPAGNRLAYLLQDSGTTALRVRSLGDSATTTTIASGDLGRPEWLPDSDHLVFAATLQASTGPITKAFLINVVTPPATLTVGLGIPSDPTVDVSDPVPSPDGHQIAFISQKQVWIMNADGTRPTALTRFDPDSFPYSCLMPAWTRA